MSKPAMSTCANTTDYMNKLCEYQRDKIEQLQQENAELNSIIIKCTADLLLLKYQIDDEVLKEKVRVVLCKSIDDRNLVMGKDS